MTAGLIVNPRSGNMNGKGLALADRLGHTPDVDVAIIDHFEALPAIRTHLRDRP